MAIRTDSCKLAIIGTITMIMLIATGCAQPQRSRAQAVSLYVDAMILNEQNEKDEAIGRLIEAIEIDPKFAMAHSFKGDIHQEKGEYEDSADSYEAATLLDPWSSRDFFNLGKVARIMEQFLRAVKAYVRACELEPAHFGAHLGAANCYYKLEDYESAFEYTQIAEEIDPNSSEPQLLLADIFEAQKDHEQAIAAYRRALEIEGNKPQIMVPLARSYLRAKRYDTAKELLATTIEADPNNSLAYQYLGYADVILRDFDTAIVNYRKAIQTNTGDWAAQKGLGVAYMFKAIRDNNDKALKEEAVRHWNTSLQINPDQPKLHSLLEKYSK